MLFYFSFNFQFHASKHTSALHAFDFTFNAFHHVYMFIFIVYIFLCLHFSTICPIFICLHLHLSFFLTFLSYIQCPLYRHSCGQSDRHSPLHLLSLIYRSICRTKSRSVFNKSVYTFYKCFPN